MDEKSRKDLTSLSDLEPTENPDGGDREPTFNISPESDALPALEGLEDLMAPISPTSTGVGAAASSSTFTFSADANAPESSFEGLPPIDPEIQSLAEEGLAQDSETGAEAPVSPEPPVETLVLDSPEKLLESPVSDAQDSIPSAAATPVGAAIAASLESTDTRHYSDHVAAAAAPTLATNPYSLRIDGILRQHEREALVQILTRENLGIREVELEPQFAAGQILIPRVSEFAGVQIVQALRNSTARMRLGPSDRIFASKESHDEDPLIYPPNPDAEVLITEEVAHQADQVALTTDDNLPGKQILQAMDVLHGSVNLKASHVAQPQSPVFHEAIERLKRQLKFQAHHRGANALLGFHYEFHPLEGQTLYKLVVQARAVRVDG